MGIYVCMLCLGLTVPGVFPTPTEMNPATAVLYLEGGGLLSYDLRTEDCVSNLPPTIPIVDWGDNVDDILVYDSGFDNFTISVSTRRGIDGKIYNLTGGAARFTKVDFVPESTNIEITDVNEDSGTVLKGGTITCKFARGITLYGRITTAGNLENYTSIVSRLQSGYDVTYTLTWDKCSPSSTPTNLWWSGRISGYRFTPTGDVEFTQLVDTVEKELYMSATVHKTKGTVQVNMYSVDRKTKAQSEIETRTCVLGFLDGFCAFEA